MLFLIGLVDLDCVDGGRSGGEPGVPAFIALNGPKEVFAAKNVAVHSNPASEATGFVVPERGAEFPIAGSESGWWRQELAGGDEGWAPKSEICIKAEHDGSKLVVEDQAHDGVTAEAEKLDN